MCQNINLQCFKIEIKIWRQTYFSPYVEILRLLIRLAKFIIITDILYILTININTTLLESRFAICWNCRLLVLSNIRVFLGLKRYPSNANSFKLFNLPNRQSLKFQSFKFILDSFSASPNSIYYKKNPSHFIIDPQQLV